MTSMTFGDLAGSFSNRLQTARIKADLLRLNTELSSGRPTDLVAHLGGDTAQLAQIDRETEVARARSAAATGLGQFLATMQTTLDGIEAVQGRLADALASVTPTSSALELGRAGSAGAAAFRDVVGLLNADYGAAALFAGAVTDGPALASADAMLASLSAAAAGAVTTSDVIAAVDAWFDDPSGGFATMGYLGDSGAALTRQIDEGTSVTVAARADHPAIKDVLRNAAIVALSADSALGLTASTSATLLTGALPGLMTASTSLLGLRAEVGLAEERVAAAQARNGAMVTALTVMRNDLGLVDPYATAIALKEAETRLETQFVVTARLSGLSLVNYLR